MPVLVGLNGFGRIGRIILRTCILKSNIEITAINDPVIDVEYICYLLKFDSTHGKLTDDISYSDSEIIINGKKIKVFHEKLPSAIPWHALDVEYVVEASGMFSNVDEASGHLSSTSVKCVLVTAPSADIPMLILGVNEQLIKEDQRIISCASSTLYCLAPIVKVLEDTFGISEGFVTSIHAMTPSLKPSDGLCLKGRHWRDYRSIHQNIIPAATDACEALGKIIPSVNDKFCGLAFRVPIANVSVLDITVRLNKSTSVREIAAQIGKEGMEKMNNIITTSYDEAVSSDFSNNENSCILDVNSSLQLTPSYFKLICWYENEYSYASRVIDTIYFLRQRFKSKKPTEALVPVKLRSESTCETINRDVIKKHKSTQIFNNTSKGNLNIKISNVHSTKSNADWNLNEKAKKIEHSEKSYKIKVNDVNSNTNIVQRMNIPSTNIIENRERLEIAKKELARITSKTEDLLKEANDNKSVENVNSTIINKPSSSHLKTNYADDNNVEAPIELNNGESKVKSIAKVNHIDSFLKILSEIKTHKVEEAVADIDKQLDDIRENAIEEEVINVEQKTTNMSSHNVNASIIISDGDGKDNTIVTITGKHIETVANGMILNRPSCSHERFKCNKSESNIGEQNDIACTLKLRNRRLSTKTNKNSIIEKHNEDNSEGLVNKNSNILLVSSGSLGSKKMSKFNTNDPKTTINDKLQMAERRESLNQIIKKKVMSSDLKSNGDILPMFNSFELINNRERLAKENLLDKLASETDSDFSFRMDEKNSQVIDITDLCSSTDDLARLDKICRIIEISDELSDELFSALKTSSGAGNKQWSFNELCETIKLDEFCRKVFGQ